MEMCTSCISCLFSICVALLVFNSCGLKASSEKETMTLHVCVVCVLMISKMDTMKSERHHFLVYFSSGSFAVYSYITFTGTRLVAEQQRNCTTWCMCVHQGISACVCLWVLVCVTEYAHCTQPAQGEDLFSHQIFTSNHRLPAACCYNAHILLCYSVLDEHSAVNWKKVPRKMFEQSILRISFQCLQLPWKCTHKSNV